MPTATSDRMKAPAGPPARPRLLLRVRVVYAGLRDRRAAERTDGHSAFSHELAERLTGQLTTIDEWEHDRRTELSARRAVLSSRCELLDDEEIGSGDAEARTRIRDDALYGAPVGDGSPRLSGPGMPLAVLLERQRRRENAATQSRLRDLRKQSAEALQAIAELDAQLDGLTTVSDSVRDQWVAFYAAITDRYAAVLNRRVAWVSGRAWSPPVYRRTRPIELDLSTRSRPAVAPPATHDVATTRSLV